MAKLSWSVVAVLLLCCAVVLAKKNSTTSSPSPSPSPSHPKVSTSVPNPSNSSAKSTPAKSSTSTKKPVKPTSTPTPPPPTPKPTPLHNDTLYKLMTADGKNVCILLNATMHLLISYNGTVKGKNVSHFLNISVPDASYVNVSGRCNSSLAKKAKESAMTISWKNNTAKNITLTFLFKADFNDGSRQWNLSNVTVFVPIGVLTNSSLNTTRIASLTSVSDAVIGNQDFMRAYMCQSNQNITFPKINNVSMFLSTKHFESQAFIFTNSTSGALDDDSAARCAADVEGSKIVPIAVGAALAGLVIIVLIAYIIGRLRSRKTGSYEALS